MNVGVFYADTFEYKNTKLAALHDIGKAAIPELIKLARPFNRDQRLEMQMHTTYDARIIETMMPHSEKEDPRMVMARYIALHHHQTFKGKGSPRLKLKKLSDMHLSISDHQQSWEYDRGREELSLSPPSEPCVRFSRTRLSSRWFQHRGWLASA